MSNILEKSKEIGRAISCIEEQLKTARMQARYLEAAASDSSDELRVLMLETRLEFIADFLGVAEGILDRLLHIACDQDVSSQCADDGEACGTALLEVAKAISNFGKRAEEHGRLDVFSNEPDENKDEEDELDD